MSDHGGTLHNSRLLPTNGTQVIVVSGGAEGWGLKSFAFASFVESYRYGEIHGAISSNLLIKSRHQL